MTRKVSTAATVALAQIQALYEKLKDLHTEQEEMAERRKQAKQELRDKLVAGIQTMTLTDIKVWANRLYWLDRFMAGLVHSAYREAVGHAFKPEPFLFSFPCADCEATIQIECSSWAEQHTKAMSIRTHARYPDSTHKRAQYLCQACKDQRDSVHPPLPLLPGGSLSRKPPSRRRFRGRSAAEYASEFDDRQLDEDDDEDEDEDEEDGI